MLNKNVQASLDVKEVIQDKDRVAELNDARMKVQESLSKSDTEDTE